MAPPVESNDSVFLKKKFSAEARQLGTSSMAKAKSASIRETKEHSSASSLVIEILNLKSHDEIEKKAIEVNGTLSSEWKKGSDRNMTLIDDMLEAAKVLLTKLTYIPLRSEGPGSLGEMLIVREILEIGAKASVEKRTEDGILEFERYMAQLKQYYFDLKDLFPKDSESMYEILGMNLLNLLSQNRVSEFHTELELFVHPDASKVLNNVYIKKAVEMEQFLTEGRYNQILCLHMAKLDDPKLAGLTSSGFKILIDRVAGTSQSLVADVLEKSFDRVTSGFIQKSLNIQSLDLLKQVVDERKWRLEKDGYVYFEVSKNMTGTIPSAKLAVDALKYAKELDKII